MSRTARDISNDELQAYVDGELSARRRAEIASRLADDPTASAAAEQFRLQNEGLKALYDDLLDRPVPDRLKDALYGGESGTGAPMGSGSGGMPGARSAAGLMARFSQTPRWATMTASFLVGAGLVAGSGYVGWTAHQRQVEQTMVDARIEAFLDQVQSSYTLYSGDTFRDAMGNDGDDAVGQLVSAVEDMMGTDLRTPRALDGFQYQNGHAIPIGSGVGAVMVFQDQEDRRFAVHMQANWDPTVSMENIAVRDDLSFYYWFDGPVAYAIAGALEEEALRELAAKLYGD